MNGQTFTVTSSPQTVTLTNLTANGNAVNVTAFFTNTTACNFTQNNAFTAPASCTPTPCAITAISAGTQSACAPATNTYSQAITITYNNAPTGTINVNSQTFAVTSSPQTVTLTGLIADGNPVNVMAFFTNTTACNFTQNNAFTAPVSCTTTPCAITAISAGTQSACAPATNTYTQAVTITYNNAPTGTINVNSQTFAVTSSPQTVTLTGLIADGNPVNVMAFFTNTTACNFTQNNAFTAPVSCTATLCAITDISAGTQTSCIPAMNTYTQEIILTYTNPSSGTMSVNGQNFNVTSSPQTITLTGLTADGNSVDVTAFFNSGMLCSLTEVNVFTAPVNCASTPCAITAVSAGTQSPCTPGTNSYTQTITVSYNNAPLGTLNVNGQLFPITSSPQTVVLNGLVADGLGVTVVASFTGATSCNYTENLLFIAPNACSVAPTFDSLVVIMYPNGAGTLFVGNDVITNTPYTGYYPTNALLDLSAQVNSGNIFNYWRLNSQVLLDYSPSTDFLFIDQDTLFAYFNGAVGIGKLPEQMTSFRIYPTVVDDFIKLEFELNESGSLSVQVFGIDGKLISTLVDQSYQANLLYQEMHPLNVASGLYFITVNTNNNSYEMRIIKR